MWELFVKRKSLPDYIIALLMSIIARCPDAVKQKGGGMLLWMFFLITCIWSSSFISLWDSGPGRVVLRIGPWGSGHPAVTCCESSATVCWEAQHNRRPEAHKSIPFFNISVEPLHSQVKHLRDLTIPFLHSQVKHLRDVHNNNTVNSYICIVTLHSQVQQLGVCVSQTTKGHT